LVHSSFNRTILPETYSLPRASNSSNVLTTITSALTSPGAPRPRPIIVKLNGTGLGSCRVKYSYPLLHVLMVPSDYL